MRSRRRGVARWNGRKEQGKLGQRGSGSKASGRFHRPQGGAYEWREYEIASKMAQTSLDVGEMGRQAEPVKDLSRLGSLGASAVAARSVLPHRPEPELQPFPKAGSVSIVAGNSESYASTYAALLMVASVGGVGLDGEAPLKIAPAMFVDSCNNMEWFNQRVRRCALALGIDPSYATRDIYALRLPSSLRFVGRAEDGSLYETDKVESAIREIRTRRCRLVFIHPIEGSLSWRNRRPRKRLHPGCLSSHRRRGALRGHHRSDSFGT